MHRLLCGTTECLVIADPQGDVRDRRETAATSAAPIDITSSIITIDRFRSTGRAPAVSQGTTFRPSLSKRIHARPAAPGMRAAGKLSAIGFA